MSTTAQSSAKSAGQEESRGRTAAGFRKYWPRVRLFGEMLYQQIDQDRLFTQAAALTYKTLFSLLPVFVLTLLILSMISAPGGQNALEAAVKNMLFQQLQLDQLPMTDDAGNPLVDKEGHKVYLSSVAERLLDRAKAAVTDKAATLTGLIAFAILLYSAISLMVVIEGSFNEILGAGKSRSWPRRIMLYWCVLTLGPIGIAASIILGRSALAQASSLAATGWILPIVNVCTAFAVSWILLLFMFRIIPETLVTWRAAAIGSFVGAILWELGKWGFGIYVDRSLRSSAYGSMAIIPVFMLWIYLTWSVVLIGLEISDLQQNWKLHKRRFLFQRVRKRVLSDIRWVLGLGALLYRSFREGKPLRAYEAADHLALPNDVTEQLLEGLADAGLVNAVRGGGYTLARPPESISAQDLLTAVRVLCEPPVELKKQTLEKSAAGIAQLDELEAKWAKSHFLPALAGEPAEKSP